MRMELRVCQQCYDGEHGNPEKTDVTRDMVECAEQVREYKDLIGLDSLYITRVTEGDTTGSQALPAIVSSIRNDQIELTDTQLVMEDDDGNMLVYPDPADILEVLTRNLDQIRERTRQDISVDLSETGEEIVSQNDDPF